MLTTNEKWNCALKGKCVFSAKLHLKSEYDMDVFDCKDKTHSGKFVTIRKSNHALCVYKEHFEKVLCTKKKTPFC